jgi:hypothetical protein
MSLPSCFLWLVVWTRLDTTLRLDVNLVILRLVETERPMTCHQRPRTSLRLLTTLLQQRFSILSCKTIWALFASRLFIFPGGVTTACYPDARKTQASTTCSPPMHKQVLEPKASVWNAIHMQAIFISAFALRGVTPNGDVAR